MSKNIQYAVVALWALAILSIASVFLFGMFPRNASASAPAGLQAQVATSSTVAVGPQNNMIIAGTTTRETNYTCAARIVTTDVQPIRVSFASLSSTTLSTSVGALQPASTTVAYDGGLYGCGLMTARGLYSSTTITVTETR